MANGSSRVLPVLLSVVVGFVVGWFVKRPAPDPFASRNGFLIRVHSDGKLSMDPVTASRKLNHQVAWTSDLGVQTLEIVFHEKDFPTGAKKMPPFEEKWMTHKGGDWIVRCGGGTCYSGDINSNLDLPDGTHLDYKYDQIVDAKAVDGMIIIRP
jgi:hypothetical protein